MKYRARLICLAALLAVGCGIASDAAAACTRELEMPVSLLGYVTYRAADGRLAGYAIDQMNELARRSGCRIRAEEYPAQRQLALARSGATAIQTFSGEPPKAMTNAVWVPMLTQRFSLLVRRPLVADDATLDQVLADPAVVVGVVRGLNYGPVVQGLLAALPDKRKDVSDTQPDLARKFAAGRIGATPGFPVVYRKWVDELKLGDQVRSVPINAAGAMPGGWTFYSPPLSPDERARLVRAAEAMRDDGTDLGFLARYIGEREARASTWTAPPK